MRNPNPTLRGTEPGSSGQGPQDTSTEEEEEQEEEEEEEEEA